MNNWLRILLSFFALFRANTSTDATNVDADTENQIGATFSSSLMYFKKTLINL